ncbi:uncharacterized protein EI90DRAFT_3114751 [Cantharellus anzutake]|uniref:uncharacterized protein n=1 Tax=Cantharellus anzutake TaxID=1750568 RepID=UPI00190505E4|nr:uncharacterized protein EI90DRAFT_3114751 [Cantharellus anzutake]KAF8344083.1 hypothetical protein EI90DRAFT_3114751 [Cantharellus anzutake]
MSAEDTQPSLAPVEQEQWPATETTPELTAKSSAGGPKSDTMEVERVGGAQGQPESAGAVGSNPSPAVPGAKHGTIYREKQIKANKVYIGGLPETTRQEDLQACFGKIGRIVNIELKTGYGFVEFDNRQAAVESVSEYHEGYFMGNKIRVELSHGGSRTAKFSGEPGACFKCGQHGHWARECPNHVLPLRHNNDSSKVSEDAVMSDRVSHSGPRGPPRHEMREHAHRDDRNRYDYPARDVPRDRYRDPRPPSPPGYRDYPPPPSRGPPRDFYDDRRDYRGPPPPPRYEGRPPYPEYDYPPPRDAYGPRPGYAPPPRDMYDRRASDRFPYPPPPGDRPRSPGPPRGRDEFRDYPPYPPRAGYRVRSPRPTDYPPQGYRRRSVSPRGAFEDNGHDSYGLVSAIADPLSNGTPRGVSYVGYAGPPGYPPNGAGGGRYPSPPPPGGAPPRGSIGGPGSRPGSMPGRGRDDRDYNSRREADGALNGAGYRRP